MSTRLFAIVALCASIMSAGCLQTTEPIRSRAPSTHASAQSPAVHQGTVALEPQPSAPRSSALAAVVPGNAPGRLIFPVHEGNRWRYRSDQVWRRFVGGVELPLLTKPRVYDEVIVWTSPAPVGTRFQLLDPHGAYFETPIYRQDASGLYVRYEPFAPNAVSESPVSGKPGLGYGPVRDEITLLRYPLHVGQRWRGRLGEEWVVEGVEVLDLLPGRMVAFRIKTGTTTNWSRDWYGPCGRIRSERYLESPLVENGQVIGTTISHRVDVLESIDLIDCGRCTRCR